MRLSLMSLACITNGNDNRVSSYDIHAFKSSFRIIYIIIKINKCVLLVLIMYWKIQNVMENYYIHICNIKTLIVSESLYLFYIINFL